MDRFYFKKFVTTLIASKERKIIGFCNFEKTEENIYNIRDYLLKKKFTDSNQNLFLFDLRSCSLKDNLEDYKLIKEKSGEKGIYVFAHPSKEPNQIKLLEAIRFFSDKEYVQKIVIIDFVDYVNNLYSQLDNIAPVALDKKILMSIYSS